MDEDETACQPSPIRIIFPYGWKLIVKTAYWFCRARLRRLWCWHTGDIVPPQSAEIINRTCIGGLEARYTLVNGISGTSNLALRLLVGCHGSGGYV